MRPSNAYQAEVTRAAQPAGEKAWRLELDPQRGTTLTFALPEESMGWPGITIEAPAGTTLEMMQLDGHQVGGPALLNTHYHKWARFTCREGVNHFRWILHRKVGSLAGIAVVIVVLVVRSLVTSTTFKRIGLRLTIAKRIDLKPLPKLRPLLIE